jgi:hypothetical protein
MGLAVFCLVACNKPAQPVVAAHPAAAPVNASVGAQAAREPSTQYVSVFEDLPPPQGKDPFFPKSHRRDPAPTPIRQQVATGVAPAPVIADLVLKGVVGSATRRLALINNETMEVGETSSVRVPDGHVRVRCLEIGSDYVLIKVEGEDQPKRLELGK